MDAPLETYIVTLTKSRAAHDELTARTGLEGRWFDCAEKLFGAEVEPAAVFVCVDVVKEQGESLELISKLKEAWPVAPLFLSGEATDISLISESVALGVDDFVPANVNGEDLRQRLTIRRAALARRAARETLMLGNIKIDTLQRSVSSPKGVCYLSPIEIKLITELVRAEGNVVARETLKSRCWPDSSVSDNALNRKLYEVRRRITPVCGHVNIRTIYGVGFVLELKS